MSNELPPLSLGLSSDWFAETSFHRQHAFATKIKKVLHREQSPFQRIDVLDTHSVGKLLLLDGKTMVSERDEFVYHECVTHVPMMVARNARRVLVVGGGDGGAIREFVKYPDLDEIHLVEIDERVVEVSKQYFPDCTSGLNDPRVTVFAQDGLKFIQGKVNYYDVVVVDSTDPEDFAAGLFQTDFYQMVFNALTPQGIMVAQTENPFLDEYNIGNIYHNLRSVFTIVASYFGPMIIYPGVYWSFAFASKHYHPTDLDQDKLSFMDNLSKTLKWYNPAWHQGVFSLGNLHQKVIKNEYFN